MAIDDLTIMTIMMILLLMMVLMMMMMMMTMRMMVTIMTEKEKQLTCSSLLSKREAGKRKSKEQLILRTSAHY